MAIRTYRPTSAGMRFRTGLTFDEVTKATPQKGLRERLNHSGGRNNTGRVTADHRGGGHKRLYRLIDFKRNKFNIPAKVEAIEYDPNRSARIALLCYADGERRYILAPERLQVGATVVAGDDNIGKGGQLVRSAGLGAQLMAKEGAYALLKLPSGELRYVLADCRATVGQVGNADQENGSWGKAGRVRWLGFRPATRGIAKNPVDHPHGGGEGRSKGNHPMTPWGKPTKGYKTRKNHSSDKYIVQRRKGR